MYHQFKVKDEFFLGTSLQNRIAALMLSEMIEVKFAAKVSHILSRRNWGREEMDPNDECGIRNMNGNIESGVNAYCALKRLYKSEFDDFEQLEEGINKAAELYSEELLKQNGWMETEGEKS